MKLSEIHLQVRLFLSSHCCCLMMIIITLLSLLSGTPKILEVSLDCQGHDAERLTESNEMMDNGYARNFITVKKGRFNILVEDEDPLTSGTGHVRGRMESHLDFRSELCTPVGTVGGRLH